jgi:hypothetical protein
MAKEMATPKFERRNEKDLLRSATDALPSDFPNPGRVGCPEGSALEAIAGRRLSFPDIDDIVDHIATCSPCFIAYNGYRKKYCSRNNRSRSIAGVALLAALLATWYFAHPFLAPSKRTPPQLSEVSPPTAILDFHDRTSERSDQAPAPRPIETPHLRRSLLNLQIRLPLGTEDGEYALQFRNSVGGITVQATGTVKWDGATETLSARVDLRTIAPGQYTLAVRKGISRWRQYSVFVD